MAHKLNFVFAAIIAGALSACSQPATDTNAKATPTASTPTTQSAPTTTAKAVVTTVYEAFAVGDIAQVTSAMAPDIDWREAQGNPYADNNPYIGPDAVVSGVFMRLGGEWDGFSAIPAEYVTNGDRVVVFGNYGGTYKATGKALDVPFVHSWTVKDGKIVAFQQYTDTAQMVAVMAQ